MSVPFAEPPWQNGLPSYWVTPELLQFQKACREFITENLTQHAWEWDKEETVSEAKESSLKVPTPGYGSSSRRMLCLKRKCRQKKAAQSG